MALILGMMVQWQELTLNCLEFSILTIFVKHFIMFILLRYVVCVVWCCCYVHNMGNTSESR